MTQILLFSKPVLAGFLSLVTERFLITPRAERWPMALVPGPLGPWREKCGGAMLGVVGVLVIFLYHLSQLPKH